MKLIVGSAAGMVIGLGALGLGCQEQPSSRAPQYGYGPGQQEYAYEQAPNEYAPPPPSEYAPAPPQPSPRAQPPRPAPAPIEPVPQASSLEFNQAGENAPPPSAPPPHGAANPPSPGANVAPPAPPAQGAGAYGATEPQPPPRPVRPPESMPDARASSAQTIGLATQQIDRLQRAESAAGGSRDDIDSALSDLTNKRQKVLQDLRELDIEPANQRSAARQQFDRDVQALRDAVNASYGLASPPGQELPPQAPVAPPPQPQPQPQP